jgi:hypothetical protein
MRFADEISQGMGTPKATRPVNQSSHVVDGTPWQLSSKRTGSLLSRSTNGAIGRTLDGECRSVSASYPWRAVAIIC